ncbi:methyltransferase RsmF C-terminal domain-like protein [Aureliella helgolandensis]|uniref:Ribosomal RNA small subunit methyltransferase F n=1 Tax=Aureliella helgolandensis TaxID=2527968 RepID=A0A518GHB2_9BACT|nr:hypothetical protein [Aureliella helgolandensis]QDV27973.1 Ribosomal RNA small subunit methyltransferase F [Aureliella helgolandensis]
MSTAKIDWNMVLGPAAEVLGDEQSSHYDALQSALLQHSRRAIRPRPELPPNELPFGTDAVPWWQAGRFLSEDAVRPGGFLNFAAGDYYIQDAGSMLALALCGISPGQKVCDTCASPGGKSTAILEQLAGQGFLISNEVIHSRVALLNMALWRSGYGNQITTSTEVEVLAEYFPEKLDCVLVDAPCSGQSMVARGKQSMASFTPAQISHSAARQQRIFRAAARMVAPGGRMVYSTCTFSYAENEQIIQQFLDEHPGWEPIEPDHLEPWKSPTAAGCYRVWPHRDQCAGGFAAALRRQTLPSDAHLTEISADQLSPPPKRRPRNSWQVVAELPQEVADWFLADLDAPSLSLEFYRVGSQLHLVPAAINEALPSEKPWFEIAVAGTPIAEAQGKRWEPSYASSVLNKQIPMQPAQQIELSDDEAVQYVAGQAVRCTPHRTPPDLHGWCGVIWRGRKLSWGKFTSGVLKNHFPKVARQTNTQVAAGSLGPSPD